MLLVDRERKLQELGTVVKENGGKTRETLEDCVLVCC